MIQTAPQQIVRAHDAATWINEQLPQQKEIIEGGILPQASIGVVGGPSKYGKSALVLNMALKTCTGQPFLNFNIPEPKKVIYLQAEISEASMQDRLRKMLAGIDYGLMPERLYVLNHKNWKLDRQRDIDFLNGLIERHGIDVLILDPLYKFHSGDENKVSDMARAFDRVDSLIQRHGISVVIVHHFGKPQEGRTGATMFRGSSTIVDYGDSYLMLRRKSGDESRNYLKLDFTLRNAAEPDTMILYRNPETLWYEVQGVESEHLVSVHDCVSELERAGGSIGSKEMFIDLLKGRTGASERTIGKVIDEAEGLKRILSRRGAGKGKPKMYFTPGNAEPLTLL